MQSLMYCLRSSPVHWGYVCLHMWGLSSRHACGRQRSHWSKKQRYSHHTGHRAADTDTLGLPPPHRCKPAQQREHAPVTQARYARPSCLGRGAKDLENGEQLCVLAVRREKRRLRRKLAACQSAIAAHSLSKLALCSRSRRLDKWDLLRTPLAISAKIHPMLQMSTGKAYFFVPSSTSGARYHSVTTYKRRHTTSAGAASDKSAAARLGLRPRHECPHAM